MRPLSLCALLCALPCVCHADEAAPAETVVRLRVQPMAAPTPALRYQLLPEMREMNPGNPIQGYLICFMEQNHFYYDKTEQEDREKWQTMPLKDLPAKELHDYGGAGLRQADFAARLDKPDWQILPKLRRDGFYTLLPEVQQMRKLAAALKVRFRAEVADRRFDDALVTAKTMFALSRHLGEHPTFIGDLVGVAIATLTIGPVEEMIQQPGAPNLYWALTDLPAPFIDLREGRQGERDWAEVEFRLLDDKEPMSDAQLKQFLDRIRTLLEADKESPKTGFVKGDPAEWVAAQAKNEERVRAGRKRLVESGLAEEKVKQFPVQQVILLDEKREYEIQRDRVLTMTAVPYWEAEKVLAAGDETLQKGEHLFPWWPAVIKVRQATARLDQRIALLRCVEALRMHAAENDGKLPAKLDEVKLPLPVDPVTGKPFPYHLDGGTATLRGTPPAGQENNAAFNVRYEVTIVK
jgi:hypothetical protein